ncbi:MAG TPA: hypothetical protein PK926_14150 [Spirochaetota bacterium]|nr:hypothetical protein [Spirochaetota bacterium]HPI90124.1 hypothetical protein [Spirochaetota bacterium]HPR49160.1 hypothetical protein [Spirochaetota bacterium]
MRITRKIILPLVIVLAGFALISCDNDLFSYVSKMSDYGPKWTASGNIPEGGLITVTFPDDVINADVIDNYEIVYAGAGTVSISGLSYDSATFTATLSITCTDTDGSYFYIRIVSSDTPVTMGTWVIDDKHSPSYRTTGGTVTAEWDSGGVTTLGSSTEIYVYFSEAVSNADDYTNYQVSYSGSGTVGIGSVTYNSSTYQAVLTVICTGTDGSDVTFRIIEGTTPITNGQSVLSGVSSSALATPDLYAPAVSVVSPDPSTETIYEGDVYIYITFSENVNDADNVTTYNTGGITATSVTLVSITYDEATFTATLYLTVTGSYAPNQFYLVILPDMIYDGNSNYMSSSYTIEYPLSI